MGKRGGIVRALLPPGARDGRNGSSELTGFLGDCSALFGVLAEIEALGPELLELRQIPTGPKSP
jgi:hypothetical protein